MTRGFIALLTVIIVSAVLLALVSASDLAVFLSRFSQVSSEQHAVALALAEGCQQIALLNLAQNSAYDPVLEPHQIGNATCYIQDVVQLSGNGASKTVRIDTWAHTGDSFATVAASAQLNSHVPPQVVAVFEQ